MPFTLGGLDMFRRKSSNRAGKRSSYGGSSSGTARADQSAAAPANTAAASSADASNSNAAVDSLEASKWKNSDLQQRLAGERRRRLTSPGTSVSGTPTTATSNHNNTNHNTPTSNTNNNKHSSNATSTSSHRRSNSNSNSNTNHAVSRNNVGHSNNASEDLFLTLAKDVASTKIEDKGSPAAYKQQQQQQQQPAQRRRSRSTIAAPTSGALTSSIAPPKLNTRLASTARSEQSPASAPVAPSSDIATYHSKHQSADSPSYAAQKPPESQSSNRSRSSARPSRRALSVGDTDLTIKVPKALTNYPHPNSSPMTAPLVQSYEQSSPTDKQYLYSPPHKQLSGLRQAMTHTPADAESVTSTTAASTVWDELDELKSRIRHLELGNGSGSKARSGEAGLLTDPNERPYTATTATTTSTSSHNAQLRNQPYQNGFGSPNTASNLLRSALGKSKILVDQQVYQSLESSVSDALSVAAMINGLSVRQDGALMSAGGGSGADKRVKRQSENLCRSLTELCISLCEYRQRVDKLEALLDQSPPGSRGKMAQFHQLDDRSPSDYLQQRRARLDQSDARSVRTTASRQVGMGIARPDSRRSSLVSRGGDDTESLGPPRGNHRVTSAHGRDDGSEYAYSEQDAGQLRSLVDGHYGTSSTTKPSPRLLYRNYASATHRPGSHLQNAEPLSSQVEQTLAANRSNMSLNSTRSTVTYASALPHQEYYQHINNDAMSIRSTRYPPSVAESRNSRFFEEKKQQRVASAGQLTGLVGFGYGGGRPESSHRYGGGGGGGGRAMPGAFIQDY